MKIKFCSADDFYFVFDLNETEAEEAKNYIDGFDGDEQGVEVSFSYTRGAIIFRYFTEDTGYYFSAPYALSHFADVAAAFMDISEYCKLEAIPEIITDVLPEEVEYVLRGARHYDVDSDEDGVCMVRIYTECMLAEELPECECDGVYLGEFAMKYAHDYEKLVDNVNLNRYFGYNIKDDVRNGNGEEYIAFVRGEFERGESMTFAATLLGDGGENVFVGEGCLYAFDGRGGASLSFRVLPEYHRRSVGTSMLKGLLKIGKELGLEILRAEVMKENLPSLSLLSRYSTPIENKDKLEFVFTL